MKRKHKLAAVGLAAAMGFGGTACGMASSAINELCLVYTGGVTEDKAFEKLLPPGSNNNGIGMGSSSYCYRIDQRSYISDEGDQGDTGPVRVVTDDDVRMLATYELYFTLNQDEKVLRTFHENLGVKSDAWTEDGWRELLRTYFEPQIERALESAALKFPWRDLYGSEDARKAFNAEVVQAVKANLREVIGAGSDYFCGPAYQSVDDECGDFTFTVGKPSVENPEIVAALEAEQTANARTVAQDQENLRTEAELRAEREIVALYGPEGALFREAIRSGKVSQIIVDQTGRATVPAGAGQ